MPFLLSLAVSYYLVNVTPNTRLSVAGSSLATGEKKSFKKLTAEILLSQRRGDIRIYDQLSDLEEVFEGWSVQTIEVPLDAELAATLPPIARVPTQTYVLIEPGDPADPLEAYVPSSDTRLALNNYLGIFRAAELSFFVRPLRLPELGLTDARGLEQASHTSELVLAGNPISKLGDLSAMKSLKVLDLTGCDMSVITGLHRLEKLEQLRLNGNNLTVLGSFSKLSNIDEIDVRNNSLGEGEINQLIGDLFKMRYQLGRRNAIVRLEGNESPGATFIDRIQGTGGFEGEGLIDMGCVVTYDAP